MSREKEVKNKDEKVKKKRKRYSFMDMLRRERNTNRSRRYIAAFRGTIIALIFLILGWFLLSGKINQREVFEKFIDKGLEISHKIADKISNLFVEDSPLEISEDGVYLK